MTETLNQLETNGDLPVADTNSGCCRVGSIVSSPWTAGVLLFVAIAATGIAGYLMGQTAKPQTNLNMPFPLIDATAAVSSDKFSMATGMVGDQAEGLFVLDHNSGLLQCSVLYPRLGKFMALFTANVGEALATGGKGGKYMMVTGLADFPQSNRFPAAASVIYVLDTATGNYACYGIPFNRTAMNSGQPQQGVLRLVATGTANPVMDRDSLR